MTAESEELKRTVLEMLSNSHAGTRIDDHKPSEPTDKQIVAAILGSKRTVTEEEALQEEQLTTTDDYDYWVRDAIFCRQQQHIGQNVDGDAIEHPTARVFRIGIESILAGKASPSFIGLLELIQERAEMYDVLHLMFPTQIRSTINKAQLRAAANSLDIVNRFREYLLQHPEQAFGESKAKFKLIMENSKLRILPKKIDRALEEHSINWRGKTGPIPTKKRKET